MVSFAGLARWSLTTWLLIAGAIGIAIAVWSPYLRASRVARIEGRACAVAEALLAVAMEWPGDPLNADAEAVRAELHRRCRDLGHPDSSLVDASPLPRGVQPPAFAFVSRHYVYLLARTPMARYGDGGVERVGPLEVLAWPSSFLVGGRTAFFFAADAKPAFTRNLVASYEGTSRAPRPGFARRRANSSLPEATWYRGEDDERWLELPTP